MASAPATAPIRFRTLGATDLRDPTGEEVRGVLAQPKRLALLAYLAIAKPGGFHRRDTLLGLFWPELDIDHARDALNQAIRHLRSELGAEVVVSRGAADVGVDANLLWCDAVAFRQAVAADQPEQALELYQGDLFEGFFASGAAPEFDQWLESQRSDVRRCASTAALDAAERAAARGDVPQASAWARRVIELRPESEDELRRVVALLDRVGERATALSLYDAFAQRVAQELDAQPTPETRQFIEGIRARQDVRPSLPNENAPRNGAAHVARQPAFDTPQSRPVAPTAVLPSRRTARRKAMVGGAVIVTGLAAMVGIVAAMRASCIGPLKTLLACGTLPRGASVLLADFVDRTGDSTLSVTITEALRVDLTSSTAIQLLQPNTVRQTLGRMRRDPNERLSPDIAREIAVREGAGAVLVGETNAAGSGFVLVAQLVAAESGDVLLAVRAEAADSTEIIDAIERLSRKLRAGIGESLLSIRASPPLERATTASLPALQRFTAGSRAFSRGDYQAAVRLLREATALDTTFAEAYRTLGAQLSNIPGSRREQIDALTRAFQFRGRLPPRMQHFVAGSYYSSVGGDIRAAVREYQAAVDVDPNYRPALNNLSGMYAELREYEHYRSTLDRIRRFDSTGRGYHYHKVLALNYLGRVDSARIALARFDTLVLADPGYTRARDEASSLGAWLGFQQRDYAQVRRRAAVLQASADVPAVNGDAYAAYADAIEGHVAEAERGWRSAIEHAQSRALAAEALRLAAGLSTYKGTVGAAADAREYLRSIRDQLPLDSILEVERPYEELVMAHARAGDLLTARRLVSEMDVRSPANVLTYNGRFLRRNARGVVALAEGNVAEAIRLFRAADSGSCVVCALPDLARAYDRSNNTDSAVAVYERYVTAFDDDHWQVDPVALAPALRRLGELFEKRGDTGRALRYYSQFVDLWKSADAELQPQVREVQDRLTRLADGKRVR